ncbi:hypothetical protein Q8V88_002590 [Enterobacter hormaechei]|nr:hypothetical protein [Enterobacter hormaechei]
MTPNKYAALRATIARAKRHDCQKVVMRVTLAEELLDQLSNAEKLIAELQNDEVRQRLANAEHQLHMAELAKHNMRASRKAQFRMRKAAERRIAELTESLKQTVSGYKSCLRTGHDRILDLGGDCDSPEEMIAGNPDIQQAEKLLAAAAGKGE